MADSTSNPICTHELASEIRQELRSILRLWDDLRKPLVRFERLDDRPAGTPRFYIMFDMNPRRIITGLCVGSASVTLPNERIEDAVLSFAETVWHLKDRLILWAVANGAAGDRKAASQMVDVVANQHVDLLVCADLANRKKHGENRNRSGRDPRIGEITFDTSKNGVLEIYYDGATKEREILVTEPNAIPYQIAVVDGNSKIVTHDAVGLIYAAFRRWQPLIERLGVLRANDRETQALVQLLGRAAQVVEEGQPHADRAIELKGAPCPSPTSDSSLRATRNVQPPSSNDDRT